jgi:hypothetical protein
MRNTCKGLIYGLEGPALPPTTRPDLPRHLLLRTWLPLLPPSCFIPCGGHAMVYSLNYHRPAFVRSASTRTVESSDPKDSSNSGSPRSTVYGIPKALSFDRVLNGGTFTVSASTLAQSIRG